MTALLLANGADVKAPDNNGDTALHEAALRGCAGAAKVLLAHGADPTARDTRGATPRDEALRHGHAEIVTLLARKAVVASREDSEVRPTPPQQTRIPLTPAGQARTNTRTFVRDNTAFSLDLYRQLARDEENLFLSPYSISTALAMVYAAAREKTADEMAQALHFSLDQESLHPAFARQRVALNAVQQTDHVTLAIANAIWPQQGRPLLAEYVSLSEQYYGISITPVDYINTRETARQTINAWVEEKTNYKVKELILPPDLDKMTRLVLTNAIYFNGRWQNEFDPCDTKDEPFHIAPDRSFLVPMMTLTDVVRYTKTETLQALELPYRGEQLSMLVLLPKATTPLADLERTLSARTLDLVRRRLEEKEVIVFLPRFRMTRRFKLKPALAAMGMIDAFGPKANFAGIDGNPHWYFIGEVIHKAFVDVSEEGTEAAAATAVVMGMIGIPPTPPVFRADRPFLFVIQENATGAILFLGRVVDPTKTK